MLKMSSLYKLETLTNFPFRLGILYILSAIKSAAVFEGAHTNILPVEYEKYFNQRAAIALMTVDFPVPGGPFIKLNLV
jgi:hypothetical protein